MSIDLPEYPILRRPPEEIPIVAHAERTHRRELGRRLGRARRLADLTQNELARLRYQGRSSIAHAEAGSRGLTSFDVLDYARILKVDPGWLLTGRGEAPREDRRAVPETSGAQGEATGA